MKMYTLRDRMIDYFIEPPFFAVNEEQAKASVAEAVNMENGKHAITQAPHHFELWEIGTFSSEDGGFRESKQIVCSAASLVRGNIRSQAERTAGGDPESHRQGHGEAPAAGIAPNPPNGSG